MIDLMQARQFLTALGEGPFVFQTFTDNKEIRKKQPRDPLARVMIGTFEKHEAALAKLNEQGAGIFMQVNAGNMRAAKAITGIRALFIDLDQPETLEHSVASLSAHLPRPSIVVQSSPYKLHLYWLVNDCPVDKFKILQRSLAVTFGGDASVANLDRVMRIPGFSHRKSDPVLVTLMDKSGAQHQTLKLVKAASNAPVMAAPALPGKAPAPGKDQPVTDAFGLNLMPAYEAPVVLAPGDRTHKLVSHAGYLISQGFSAEYVCDEIRRMNVDLCPQGAEPITEDQLQAEVLGAVSRFAETRAAEMRGHVPEAPPAPRVPPPPPSDVPAPYDAAMQPDSNTEVHTLDAWVDRFLFIEEGSKIADRTRSGEHAIYQYQDFQRKYSNVFVGSQAKLFNRWMANPLRQDVRSTIYAPIPEKIVKMQGVKMWNRHCPGDMKPADNCQLSAVAPFIRHIKALFPNDIDRKIFMDWVVMTVTKPEVRIPWAPLLVSEPGAGKGFIFQVMAKMMGEHNCAMINPERLENQFNGFMANSTLVCLDEMKFSTRFGVSDKLKNLISEPTLEINVKGIAERQAKVYANFIIFTNHDNAAFVEKGDRRFWIYKIAGVQSQEHFDELWEWFRDDGNLPHLLRWFVDYDIKGFKYAAHPPMTDAKREMIDASKTRVEILIEDAVECHEGPFAADIVSFDTVQAFVASRLGDAAAVRCESQLRPIWAKVSKTLPKKLSRVTLKIGDSRQVRVRCIRNHEYWTGSTVKMVGHEATRAAQMLLTPNDVLAPGLEKVK